MENHTHTTPEPAVDYIAICMAETACTFTAVGDNAEQTSNMLAGHYVTGHHASDWDKPLRGGR